MMYGCLCDRAVECIARFHARSSAPLALHIRTVPNGSPARLTRHAPSQPSCTLRCAQIPDPEECLVRASRPRFQAQTPGAIGNLLRRGRKGSSAHGSFRQPMTHTTTLEESNRGPKKRRSMATKRSSKQHVVRTCIARRPTSRTQDRKGLAWSSRLVPVERVPLALVEPIPRLHILTSTEPRFRAPLASARLPSTWDLSPRQSAPTAPLTDPAEG